MALPRCTVPDISARSITPSTVGDGERMGGRKNKKERQLGCVLDKVTNRDLRRRDELFIGVGQFNCAHVRTLLGSSVNLV